MRSLLNKSTPFINAIWRCFVSLRLTFVLLAFLLLGAIIGMFFDQTVTFEDFFNKRLQNDMSTSLLSFFELYDAFHSWWFSLAIFLLALNLIACSIERLPRIFFDYIRPRPYLTERRLLGLNLKRKIIVADEAQAYALLKNFFSLPLEKLRLSQGEGFFFQDRHALARFGVYIVHIALLITMFSSIYATQNGVDGHVLIEEGNKARFITRRGPSGISYAYDLGFYVGCDDFRLKTFIDNTPMEFESDLYISVNGEKVANKTVRVNEPLSYAGFTFYQSSYRAVMSEKVVLLEILDETGRQKHRVRLNTAIELASGVILTPEKVYEDFAGLGQAVRIAKKYQGESTYFHIFRKYPDFDRVVRNDQFSVSFWETDQQYATGLSVGKVPGIYVIFFGFMVLIIGIYMCFFMTPIRYFARIINNDGERAVWLAASAFRHPAAVKEVFDRKISDLLLKPGE